MLVESPALKNRKEIFLKHVELLEEGAQFQEINTVLGNMLSTAREKHNGSELPTIQEIKAGLHTITLNYILGKISKEYLEIKFKEKEEMNIIYLSHEADTTQWLNEYYIEMGIGYNELNWVNEKDTGYKGLREYYRLPLEGEIDLSSNLIEVTITPL